MGNSVRAFKSGNDALGFAEEFECIESFLVGNYCILCPTDFLVVGVFGTNSGIVQACGDGVHRQGFACLVLQGVAFEAMNLAFFPFSLSRCVVGCVQTLSSGFYPDELYLFIFKERCKESDGVAPTAYAGNEIVRQTAFAL